ncbi:unnamed protein product [Lactuca virosa]|uniref:Uncharacterized protein n=1 Tax=Lactuca virosa TaxID=75947 RepID=A0AAU9PW95_9ASTR|nr:unnamed protein product [Lactuca virosa]
MKVPIYSTPVQSNPIQSNSGKMSQFLLRETLKRKQHTSVRFINKRIDDAKSVGNISAPLSTPALLSSSSHTTLSSVGTVSVPTFVSHVGATSSTHASSIPTSSNQSSLPTSSTQSFVPTSIQSSTPASTTSSVPRSTTNCSESIEENVSVQHQGYLLGSTGMDGRLYIGVRDKELFPSGPCSSVVYESFGERADLNGYSWATLSDETKLLYWNEFHKKCHWDDAKTPKGSSEMHREQYEDNNADTEVEIENLKKLVETQREQYEDIQQKYEDVQQKYEDAQKKNVEFQQKNVDVQAKFEQQLAQAMNVINTLSEQVKNIINQ